MLFDDVLVCSFGFWRFLMFSFLYLGMFGRGGAGMTCLSCSQSWVASKCTASSHSRFSPVCLNRRQTRVWKILLPWVSEAARQFFGISISSSLRSCVAGSKMSDSICTECFLEVRTLDNPSTFVICYLCPFCMGSVVPTLWCHFAAVAVCMASVSSPSCVAQSKLWPCESFNSVEERHVYSKQ